MNRKFPKLFMALSLFSSNFLAAQDNTLSTGRDQGMWQTVVMIGIAMLFFYFILWRPEQKRRKALEDQRGKMKKGDTVVAMGIVGTVVKIQEHTVILKMVEGAKIEVLKGAITEVTAGSESEPQPEEKSEQ